MNSCIGEERAVIGRLRGIVVEKQPPEVLLEMGGVATRCRCR